MPAPKSVLVVNLKSLPTWHLDLAAAFTTLGLSAEVFITTPQTLRERFDKSVRGAKWFESDSVLARLRAHCRRLRPELVVFLGLFVLPARVAELLAQGLDYRPQSAAWVCDCFRQPQFADWAPADHAFYFDTFMREVLPAYYPDATATSFLPLAASPERYRPLPGAATHGARDAALVFAGNVSANRRALIEQVAPRLPLAVHGPNAAGRTRDRRRKLDSATINALYNQHAMVLNINQSPNTEHGLNLRAFEVTAAGAVLLTQDCADLPLHFEPGREVLCYGSADELVACYQAAVGDRTHLAAIAAAGLARTRAAHTFVHRARDMLRAFT